MVEYNQSEVLSLLDDIESLLRVSGAIKKIGATREFVIKQGRIVSDQGSKLDVWNDVQADAISELEKENDDLLRQINSLREQLKKEKESGIQLKTRKQAREDACLFFETVEEKNGEIIWAHGVYRVLWREYVDTVKSDINKVKEFEYQTY